MMDREELEFFRGLANCEDKEQMARYIQEHERKSMTNADRIRAMTDEELADFLDELYCHGWNHGAQDIDDDTNYHDWLQQPCGGAE